MAWYNALWAYRKTVSLTETVTVTGTIAVTNGSATVTGTGTNFLSWAVGDKIQLPDDAWWTISAIASDTSLTVSSNYTGSNASGESYLMRRINYQMPLKVYRSTGTDGSETINGQPGGKIYVSTKCETDYDDILVTKADGTTLLDYWLEYADSNYGIIHIEVAELDSDDSTDVCVYYGNASATAVSNGANTFITFDDFERGANGDAIGGSWTISQGDVDISTDHAYGGTRSGKWLSGATFPVCYVSNTPSASQAVRFRVWKEDAQNFTMGQGDGTKNWNLTAEADEDLVYYDGVFKDTGDNITADAWQLLEARKFNFTAGTFDIYLNGAEAQADATMATTADWANVILFYTGDTTAGRDFYIDDLIVRKYTANEPTFGTWGSEEEFEPKTTTVSMSALLQDQDTKTVDLDSLLRDTDSTTVDLDSILKAAGVSKTVALSVLLHGFGITTSADIDALLRDTDTSTVDIDTLISALEAQSVDLDTLLEAIDLTSIDLDTLLKGVADETITLDAYIKALNVIESVDLDALIAIRSVQQVVIDLLLEGIGTATVELDILIEGEVTSTPGLDVLLQDTDQTTVTLDCILVYTLAPELTYTIEIRNSDGDLIAILKNAYAKSYTQLINAPHKLKFKVPATDSKTAYILPANEFWLRDNRTDTVVRKFKMQYRSDRR